MRRSSGMRQRNRKEFFPGRFFLDNIPEIPWEPVPFRPGGNSLSARHLTLRSLLCTNISIVRNFRRSLCRESLRMRFLCMLIILSQQ